MPKHLMEYQKFHCRCELRLKFDFWANFTSKIANLTNKLCISSWNVSFCVAIHEKWTCWIETGDARYQKSPIFECFSSKTSNFCLWVRFLKIKPMKNAVFSPLNWSRLDENSQGELQIYLKIWWILRCIEPLLEQLELCLNT